MNAYLELSEDEVDLAIGKALLKDSLGSKPLPDPETRNIAQRWFDYNLSGLRVAICEKGKVGNFLIGPDKKERNELVGLSVDALNKFYVPNPVPVALLAVKVVHYGVGKLCDSSTAQ